MGYNVVVQFILFHFQNILFHFTMKYQTIPIREDNIPMLFSHLKISSFRAKAHVVFHWCLYNKQFHFNMIS